jgi:alpha-2-macroglobulin
LKATGTTLFSAPYSANAAKIALENKDNLNLFYQITAAGFDRELPAKETKNGIEIYREFLDSSGKPVTSIKVGDVITVKLNFRSLSNTEYRDVAIVDLCPAGLETEIESARQTERSYDGWSADYVDIREDRLVIYGTLSARMGSFSYRARAINAGTFTTPPLFAEALYDKSVWALRPQASIKIVK